MNKVLAPRFYPLNLVKLIFFLLQEILFIIENQNILESSTLFHRCGAYPSRRFPELHTVRPSFNPITSLSVLYLFMPVTVCLKCHESLSENGVLLCEQTLEEGNEVVIQRTQQKTA